MADVLDRGRSGGEPLSRLSTRWPAIVGSVLSLGGFGISGYLTFEHYTSSASLTCPASGGIVNCFKVTTSEYSKIAGIPVAVLGLVFFAVMLVLQSPRAWRNRTRPVRVGRLAWSIVGVGTAVWLIYAELFRLDAVCLWCTAVHALAILLFVSTVFATATTAEDPDVPVQGPG